MKRLTIFLLFIFSLASWATTRAFLQEDLRPRLGSSSNQRPATTAPDAMPQTYLNRHRSHKLIINNRDESVYQELAKAKAIRQEINYGSYKLVVIDEDAAGGRAAIEALQVAPRDDQNMIVFNGYLLDTSDAQPLSTALPANLSRSRMSAALAGTAAPSRGLYVVQFVGPIQDAWLDGLEQTGVKIITYVPNNAYVVRADERAAGELLRMKESHPFVQWIGDYEPAYKLTPALLAVSAQTDSQSARVTAQVIDSDEGQLLINELKASSQQFFGETRVLNYRNVTVSIPISKLTELAGNDAVFAIEDDRQPVRMDEIQGQIVAGNRSGGAPTGPGYLSWLASKGFNSSQFSSFAVNVVDDAYSLTGHPDLPDARIAFQNNPSFQSGAQGGHGFFNAHIVGGFNDSAGPAYEDANGYNYGLGIAPWARVGVTAIFGPVPPSVGSWEPTAYGQGARISSNSWGLVDATRNTINRYDFAAQAYDSIVRDAQSGTPGNQQLLVVFAAQNSGAKGENTVGTPGTAKNVITVGASENVRPAGDDGCGIGNSGADSALDIAFFSSRGPVNPGGGDGRIKPDIVAPGAHVQAGVPQSDYLGNSICDKYFPAGQTLYSWSSGTSHSTPAVAGGAALVYQNFLNQGLAAPSPAMVKAALMNSASYLTGAGANDTLPSKSQGMGLMDLGRAFDGTPRLLTDQTRTFHSSGETHYIYGSVAATDRPLRVTLAWTDAPGAVTGAPYVNNLDLELTINGQIYKGNVFSGANATVGGVPDSKNNVESIFLPAGVSGNFLVTIKATNIAGDGVPGDDDKTDQDFALVIYNANSAAPDAPIIDATPSILSFTTLVTANPADQTINIGNAGGGTLGWTVTDNAPWLTLSAASGNAPATLTASVNTSGLSAGVYNANITITSPGAFNSPVSVPVTLIVLPVFAVNPASLSFTTGLNAANPANQSIIIRPNAAALQNFTVSDDASWLTVSPTTGATPSTLTVSVNASGLTVGQYSGTIAISSTDPTKPPTLVPVTLIVYANANAGFEQTIDPWAVSGVAIRSSGGYFKSGKSYLLMGAANSSRGTCYQEFSLPRGITTRLSFWLNVESSETAPEQKDRLFVEVRDTRGRLLKNLATFSNQDNTAPGNYTLRGDYSLAEFAGRRVRLQFRTITDATSITSFRVDDVFVR